MTLPRALVLTAVAGLVASFLPGAPAAARTVKYATGAFSVTCTSSGQLCEPPFRQTVRVPNRGTITSVRYTPATGHCSSLRVHVLLGGNEIGVTDFVEPTESTVLERFRAPIRRGSVVLGYQGEGRIGGCNSGQLGGWGGTVITTVDVPAPPALGKTANVEPVKGTVLVGIPSRGARVSQKGVKFVPLRQARSIPIGSFLDTTKGTVALTTARDSAGKTQSGRFSAGLFQILQSRKRAAKGLTELRMKGSAAGFKACRAGGARAALSRRTVRRLRANAKGRYRTRGRHSAATVRGTTWTVTDRCDGTLTSVKRGEVAVRDFRLKKTIVLTAGKSYLAR